MTMLVAPLALLMFGPAVGLALIVISGVVTVYAGYRVWKAAHPAASVWREISRRTVAVITFGVSFAAVLLAMAFPQVLLVITGVWFVAVFLLAASLALGERTSR
jgi:hypothetical protein